MTAFLRFRALTRAFLSLALLHAFAAGAATYQVGPGRAYTQLTQVAGLLNPGDIVEVDGNATYNGVLWTRSGTPSQPITIRGMAGGTQRPVVNGNGAGDAFRMDVNHYLVEDLVITNANPRCVYLRGTNLTLRRVVVHTCGSHGILGSDTLTGDMTLTEVEVYNTGNPGNPQSTHHPIYIATDHQAYPGAVLRIEKSWIHDNHSGNGIKSRARQVKIFYNWIETTNGQNHTVEAIGPDPGGAPALCPIPNGSNDGLLCNGEIVGNVLISRSSNANMMRLGGDGTGNSYGRYHVVNNTFVANDRYNSSSAAMIRAFGNLQSIELHNNIFWLQLGDTVGIRIVRDAEAAWTNGRRVTGRNNVIAGNGALYNAGIPQQAMQGLTDTTFVPVSTPMFVNVNLASPSTLDLRLLPGSAARLGGNTGSTSTPGYQIPSPTNLPLMQPPRMRPDPGAFEATPRPTPTVSRGAFEYPSGGPVALALTSSVNPATVAQTVHFSVTATAPGAAPTGTIAYTRNGAPIPGCTAVPLIGGSGLCNAGMLPAGIHTIVATLATNDDFPAATSPPFTQVVTSGATLLSASPTPVNFGGQSLFTSTPPTAIVITNTTGAAVTVTQVTASFGYSVTHDCAVIPASGTCTAQVVFRPQVESTNSGMLAIAHGGGGPLAVPLTGVGERSLVTHFYRSILRRGADDAGKAYWLSEAARLAGLGVSANETYYVMAGYFFNSPEYATFNRSNAEFVADLYYTFFNRAPDSTYWTDQIAGGLPREVVLFSFMFSNEFRTFMQNFLGSTAARPEVDMVVDLFRGILNRLPDTASFNYWLGRIRAAQCAGAGPVYTEIDAMSAAFFFNPEYNNRARNNTQIVTDMYYSFLRRGGDIGGVQYWINELNTGARTLNDVRVNFINNPEFGARVQGVIAAGCAS